MNEEIDYKKDNLKIAISIIAKEIEMELINKLSKNNINDLYISSGFNSMDAFITIASIDYDLYTCERLGNYEKNYSENYYEKTYEKIANNKDFIIEKFYNIAIDFIKEGNNVDKNVQEYKDIIKDFEFKDQIIFEVTNFQFGKTIKFNVFSTTIFKANLYNYNINENSGSYILMSVITNKTVSVLKAMFKTLDFGLQKRLVDYYLNYKRIEDDELKIIFCNFLDLNIKDDIKDYIISEYTAYKMN